MPTWSLTNVKHNEANGEENRDGSNENLSLELRRRRAGTDDPAVLGLRSRQVRNFATLLMLSHGVPMILIGRRGRPHAARQQQRLLPGQRDQLVRLDADRTQRRAAALLPVC
jgi:hypothetical protein